MFCPVFTTEAHLAFAGARTHSNNTADMTAMVEVLSFLGPHGPVARDACIYYDSKHAACICLGTIQAHTHVQLALACQQSLLKVSTDMCAATPGTWVMDDLIMPPHLGHSVVSRHNLPTRWARHTFDTAACFASCNNVLYLCLSSSSDDNHLSHSCLGTGMRFGTQKKFCHYRASSVHLVSLIAS